MWDLRQGICINMEGAFLMLNSEIKAGKDFQAAENHPGGLSTDWIQVIVQLTVHSLRACVDGNTYNIVGKISPLVTFP